MTRQSEMHAWRDSEHPSGRRKDRFVVNSDDAFAMSSRRSSAGAVQGATGQLCPACPGQTQEESGRVSRPPRQCTPGRFRLKVSRPRLLLVCILYLVAQCICQRPDFVSGDSSRRFSRDGGSGLRSRLRSHEDTGREGTSPSQELGQIECRLRSTFHRVVTTDCIPCPLSSPALCPAGTAPLTEEHGNRGCIVPLESSVVADIVGCSHRCQLSEVRTECCSSYWGPMCMECPGGAATPCNNRGRCQGSSEAEQCQCSPAFTGVACALCAGEDVYGPNCDRVCDCFYGVCDAGARGTGFCLCDAGYQGPRCDQPKISCGEPACHPFAICSPPVTDGEPPQCVCSPGYSGDGRTSCVENNPCQNPATCSPHARCTHTSPGRYTCECQDGYYGDGVECYPINFCQQQLPPCPPPTSKCVFDGPRQYHCECEEDYENYVFPFGCQRIDRCAGPDAPACPPHSVCTMTAKGNAKCECLEGFRGDGQACYGSIMQVLRDLNSDPTGSLQGSLNTAISMFDVAMGYPLSSKGPYTIFAPTEQAYAELDFEINDRAFRDLDFNRYLMKLHIVPTHMDAYTLNSTQNIYTLAGIMAEVTHKEGNYDLLRYQLQGSNTRARLLHKDIPAANGVIHVIDRVLYKPMPVENNPRASVTSILSSAARFTRLNTLLMSVGISNVIRAGESVTLLAPMNKAFSQLPAGSMDHLMSLQGRPKLLALLRNHVIQGAGLLMQNLISTGHVISVHGATTYFHISRDGLISMDGGANLTLSDIGARDGYVHSIDGLIVPSDIEPLITHQCDRQSYIVEQGPCSICNDTILGSSCPIGSTPVDGLQSQTCLGVTSSQGEDHFYIGCQLTCNRTTSEPECCSGFYGQDCHPCPGGFAVPCNGHGRCSDSMRGSGQCVCNENFTGTACELCMPNLFGTGCNQTCTCLHGVCDSGPRGTGRCKGGCDLGFTGADCNIPAEGCGPQVHICHEHAVCDSSSSEIRCICQAGYSGSGLHCEPLDPCRLAERGGCHRQAFCTYLGPGMSDCTCNDGWTGDGFFCEAVDPCQSPNRGGCAEGAICAYIRPGENQCYCNLGYYGNGTFCEPINPCLLITNGGCHSQADCVQTGPGTSDCQCRDGYGGDGWLCYQSLPLEIATKPNLRRFHELIQLANLDGFMASHPGLTVFPPTDDALREYEATHGAVSQLLAPLIVKSHIVNGTMSERELYRLAFDDDQYIPSLWPSYIIQVHDCNHQLCVNDIPVEMSNILATNGLIHILGEVFDLQLHFDQGHFAPEGGISSSDVASFRELVKQRQPNSLFLTLLQQTGLVDSIDAAAAYTVFFPTDEAVASFNSSRITRDILRYHLVLGQTWTVADIYSGMHLDSSLGHNYQLRFRKSSEDLFVNNVAMESLSLVSLQGVVHFVSEVLVPLPNRCDANYTSLIQTPCGSCTTHRECPQGTTQVLNSGSTNCQYTVGAPYGEMIMYPGCRLVCQRITYIPECCSGFFGRECAECPGGWASPCSNHGNCGDGTNGTGTCSCFPNFTGTACELCEPGKYGPLCDQVCNCVNGRCQDGIHGNGRCICNNDYTGLRCDLPQGSPLACVQQCDPNAYCLDQQCICHQGYIGNGTFCQVYDPCSEDGMCSEHAFCQASPDGLFQCVCSQGYQGDGVYCEEVNPCLEDDDGGCHELAECLHTGPGMSTCHCQDGYEGNGRTRCSLVNPCLENNGGCSVRAHCSVTSLGQRNCTCFEGHIGDGLECTGNIAEEIALNPNLSTFFSLLEEYRDVKRVLSSGGPLTILVPNNQAFERISNDQIEDWEEDNQLSRVLMNHVIGCTAFLARIDNRTTVLTTLSAQPVQVMYSPTQGLTVNGEAHVTMPNFLTSNGVIHTIDRVLVPDLLDPRPDDLNELPLELVAPNTTYSIFMSLMNHTGLLESVSARISLPVTIFMPTDEAFMELYPGKLAELRDPNNLGMAREYLAYHIIPRRTIHTTLIAIRGLESTTLQGSNITIECQQQQGFLVNRDSKISDMETPFQGGLFYGLDMVLEPPSIGGRCDATKNITFQTDCVSCRRPLSCPLGSMPSGNVDACTYLAGWYNYQPGCRRECIRQEIEPHCCNYHYGLDCLECPGGKRNPCSWHGICDHGLSGSGHCVCDEGYTGVACELCLPGRYGTNCQECQCTSNGQCDDGVSGTGSCFCDLDYVGPRCDTRLPITPTCNPLCHVNALCRPGNICECRPEYYGNGYSCTVINQCSFNNGGCSMYADCSQVNTEVTCRCHDNYEGDGYICQPIDPCMMDNGGCHGNATCKLTGPNSRSCTCNPPLVGDGITFCSKPPDRPRSACSIDNGGCHENAECFDNLDRADGPSSSSDRSAPARSRGRTQLDRGGLTPAENPGVTCKCKTGYVGTGLLCNGNAFETLGTLKNLSIFYQALLGYANYPEGQKLVDELKNELSVLTLFIPINTAALANTTFFGYVIGNHIVSGQAYHRDQLVPGLSMTTWAKAELTVDVSSDGKVTCINNVPVKLFDIPTTNGVLHIISEPLTGKSKELDTKNHSGGTSISQIFAGILITVFCIILILVVAFVIFVKVKRKRRSGSRHVISRYSVNGGTEEGSVTFSRSNIIPEEEEDDDSETTFRNPTYNSRAYNSTDMDSDTVGFADTWKTEQKRNSAGQLPRSLEGSGRKHKSLQTEECVPNRSPTVDNQKIV